ncbi:STAS-like domain-containing protein [Rhodanobacter sp. 7MK24]|uniref:STAS-like domain-containing protein n=1 Tax=Rhodanobacter sp. 7MK24 TaxID=2775922 RepID=UPI00178436E9|nr:STAS-like domain-containing protein [Rhodanobacter sp. 7MK24]MBD8879807.1 STAS-like domain-containing protein [Rhodanobacter sp. 7MK24]
MNAIFKIPGTDLASRQTAVALRLRIESALQSGVVLDFGDVLSVSESYADELFGVLVEKYSLEAVFSNLNVKNASPTILGTITAAIRYRLVHRLTSGQNDAICAAQRAVRQRDARLAQA